MDSNDFKLDEGIYILIIDENEQLKNFHKVQKEFCYGIEWDKEKNDWSFMKFENKDFINDKNNLEEENNGMEQESES